MRPSPPFPAGCPTRFRATVHGTVFNGRDRHLSSVRRGDRLRLIADPGGQDEPGIWVHLVTGEPIGHLPPEISLWLWPWLYAGGRAEARAERVHGADVPSWRRVVLLISCQNVDTPSPPRVSTSSASSHRKGSP